MTRPIIHPHEAWKWYGNAAHFILGDRCQFHLATEIGPFIVSTVGDLLCDESSREITAQVKGIVLSGRGEARLRDYMQKIGFEEVGCNRLFETMVFRSKGRCVSAECSCGMPRHRGDPLAFDAYNTRADAQAGHAAMCERFARRKR